jgi:microcystin-dependent protein
MDAFVGEIRIFGFSFPPQDWAYCDGSILPLSQYQVLASVIGNTYGGTSGQTIGLPNLKGQAPVGSGQGTGLTTRVIGTSYGEESVSITSISQMGQHSHNLNFAGTTDDTTMTAAPANQSWLSRLVHLAPPPMVNLDGYAKAPATPDTVLNNATIGLSTGTGAPHQNMQPYLVMNYCIALQGIYPARG